MRVFLSLRTKLFLLFLSVTALVLITSLLVVNRYDTRSTIARIQSDLATTDRIFQRMLEQRSRQLTTNARLLGSDYAFRSAVSTHDHGTILSAAVNHQRRLAADRIIVTNSDGRLLADTLRAQAEGRDLSGEPLVAAALGGGEAGGVWVEKLRIYRVSSVPILAPDIVGALIVGFEVDNAMAAELKRISQAEVTFFADNTLTATTLPPAVAEEFKKDFKGVPLRTENVTLGRRDLKQERYLEAWGSLGTDRAAYVLQQSLDEALIPLRRLQRVLILIGLGALLLAGLVSLGFAHGITSPIRELVRGTQYVIQGRYDQRLAVRQRDEVGTLAESFNEMLKGLQERERIRSAMNKVVSKEIAEEILKGEIRLGGEIRFATILFSDIREFTGLSESMDPHELVKMLNEYLTLMSRVVQQNHGVIDKYIGDAVMALFGAPLTTNEDVDNSLQTAQDMLTALGEFNYRRAWEGKPPVRIGLGINTGPVVAGNMGSEDRLNYTVLGDTVNLASRMEGLTRTYNVNCIVSEFTHRESRRGFRFRELDFVRVKGRATPVRIFELWVKSPSEADEEIPEVLQKFQNARQFYIMRDWERAETYFRQVLEMRPDDGPSLMYLSRIEELRRTPPPETWDGVYTAITK
jgi:adenylate cyclase